MNVRSTVAQIGLLPEAPRTEGIRHSRELGFEIDDIRELLNMAAQPQSSCHQVDSTANNHLAEIDRRIASLTALKAELSPMIEECGHGARLRLPHHRGSGGPWPMPL